jgi:hypothetical protein
MFVKILVAITLVHLFIAMLQDINNRIISDKIWVSQISLSVLIILIGYLFGEISNLEIILSVVNVIIGFVFGLLFFYIGAWGGGDTKALWAISFSNPFVFKFIPVVEPYQYFPPIFPLIFNMIFGIILYVMILLVYNLYNRLVKFSDLYSEGADFSFFQKISLLITGFQIEPKNIRDTSKFDPAEEFDTVENKWTPKLSLFSEVLTDEEWDKKELELKKLAREYGLKQNRNYIWVRYQLPGLVPIFLGYCYWLVAGSPIFDIFAFIIR